MKYPFYIILIVSILLVHCTENKDTQAVQLIKTDSTLRFHVNSTANSTTRNVRYFQDKGEEYIAIENQQNPSISIYRLSDCSHVKDVVPQKQGPNGLGSSMDGFDIINFDTIIVATDGLGDRLFLIDSAACLRKTIQVPINNTRPYIALPHVFYSSFGISVNKIDSIWFMCSSCRDNEENFFKIHNYSIGYLYNANTGQVSLCSKKYPDVSEAKPFVGSTFLSIIYADGKYIVSYTEGHQIFVSNKDTIWTEHLLRSKYISSNFTKKKMPGSINESMAVYDETPEYRALIYDKYREVYYRFAYPGIEVKPDDDVFKLGEFRRVFSIMIIDKDFNIIGETLMPENTYNMNMFFVNEAGLWLSTNHVDNPNFEEDAINFELFALK